MVLVAALTKICPHRRYRVAQRVLARWGAELPRKEAPACPAELLFASVVWLHLNERRVVATVCLLCFVGLLRVSECLQLLRRNVVMGADYVVLFLDRTKRGVNEKVVISHPAVVAWLRSYLAWHTGANHERAFSVSYTTVAKWLRRAAAALNFADLDISTHSLRRGGATELLRRGVPFAEIALFGRWQSENSVRLYLRAGEVALTRAAHHHSREEWERLRRIASLHVAVWDR